PHVHTAFPYTTLSDLGGPFAIRHVDLDRGEIMLERNDRYWGEPARSDLLVLRKVDKSHQVNALRSGDTHVAVLNADEDTMNMLRDRKSTRLNSSHVKN